MFSGEEGKKRRVYSSKYALSSICTCSRCGDIYRRIAWNNRGKHSIVWRCCTRVEHGPSACDAPTISESELQMATVKAINTVLKCSDSMQDILKENIEKVLRVDQTDGKLEKLNAILDAKQHELAQLAKKTKTSQRLLMRLMSFVNRSKRFSWRRHRQKATRVVSRNLGSC